MLEQVLYELRLRFVEATRRAASASSSPRCASPSSAAARRTACRRSAATARSAAQRSARSPDAAVDPDRAAHAGAPRHRHSPRAVRSILVDTSTDLRAQALANDVRRVDAILFTHSHADHVFGLDDVRRFNQMQQAPIAVLRRCADAGRAAADVRLHFRAADAAGRRRAAARAVPHRRTVLARRRRDRAGAALSRPAAGARVPHRIVRLPHRLQPHSRRVVAAARRRAHARSSTRCAHRPHSTHFSVDEALDVVGAASAPSAPTSRTSATIWRTPRPTRNCLPAWSWLMMGSSWRSRERGTRITRQRVDRERSVIAVAWTSFTFPKTRGRRAGCIRCSRSATSTACIAATARSSSASSRVAGERGATSVVMTFDPHPPRVVRPDKAPPLLMTKAQKLEAIAEAGVQGAAIVRFTPELSRWDPETFVRTVLVDWLRVGGGLGRRELPVRPRSRRQLLAAARARRPLRLQGREDRSGPLQGLRRQQHAHPAAGQRRARRRSRRAARPSSTSSTAR